MGLPRFDGEWADRPFIVGQAGPVWLDEAYQDATAPPEPVPAPLTSHQQPPQEAGAAGAPPPAEPVKPAPASVVPKPDQQEATKAELDTFARYLRKRGRLVRPFEFEQVSKADAGRLNQLASTDPDAAVELAREMAKAGGGAGARDGGGPPPPQPRPDHGAVHAGHRFGLGFAYPGS